MPRGKNRPNGAGRVDRDSFKPMRYPLFSSSLTKARIDVHNHRMAQRADHQEAQGRLEEYFNTPSVPQNNEEG